METQLLATKLFVPSPRPGLVLRPRLMEQLDSALNSPFTLVSAPAGFGKTTVLTQWIRGIRPGTKFGWIQLDAGDNDPVRFWDYLIAAVRKQHADAGSTASSMLHSPQTFGTDSVLSSLLNDLADIRDDFVLVIDDYHLIKSEAIHGGLSFLVDHCPLKLHLIVATRVDPMMPLAHFRGRGTMIEVGADDLRFTFEEADEFLQTQEIKLGRDDLGALNAKIEGWAVGLKMAAMAMRGRKDLGAFISSFAGSQKYVMDYLAEEVLNHQPEDVDRFLLTTSILEKFNAPLCDAVTELGHSRQMLAKLEQANLFLVPLDDSREWYRYHHLFAELLRHQRGIRYGTGNADALHQKASAWYEGRGLVDDAVHHAIAARDWQNALRLIAGAADAKIKQGANVTLVNWMKALPGEVRRSDMDLYVRYGRALAIAVQPDDAKAALDDLEKASQEQPGIRGRVAAIRAALSAVIGDIPQTIEMGKAALSLLAPDDLPYRGWVSYEAGFVQYYIGHFDEGWALLNQGHQMAAQSGDAWIAATTLNFLAAITQQRGRLREALTMASRALEIAGQSPTASLAHCRRCIIAYELNDLKTAEDSARLITEWSALTGKAETPLLAHLYLALVCAAHGDWANANLEMGKAEQFAQRAMPFFKARQAAGQVVLAIRAEDPNRAATWGARLADYSSVFPFEFAHVPARLLIAQGKKAEAAESLRTIHQNALNAGAHGLAIGIRVCQALAAETEEDALGFLSEALVKAEPEGYIRTFVDEGKLLAPLLRKAESRGVVPAYAAKLLRIIRDEQQRHVEVVLNSRGFPLSGPLSERELEILKLLETGLSNRQIADRLVITLSTAKTHIHNISRKLDAKTRTQAIARARDMKLL